MQITLRYFAAAVDAAGREDESVEMRDGSTVAELKNLLVDRYGEPMRKVVNSGSFLINQVVSRDDSTALSKQVDVLPPFAGG